MSENEFERMQDGLKSAKYLLIFCVIFYFIYLLAACNPSKKTARADNAALERVTAKRPLLDIAGAKYLAINPCANDTAIKYLPGDTITTTKNDTTYLPGTNDTVFKTITKTIYKIKTDSVIRTIVDKNALDSAKDAARRFELAVKDREVQIANKDSVLNKTKSSRNTYLALFVSSCFIMAILALLYVKQQFFKI